MSYVIIYNKNIPKDLSKIDYSWHIKIKRAIESLVNFPDIPSIKQMKYTIENRYRLRVGDYRVIFEVVEEQEQIRILKIAHRKDVYDDLEHL